MAGLEGRGEHVFRLHAQAGEELCVRVRHSSRRPLQAIAVRVLADGDEDLPDRFLDPLQVNGVGDRAAGQLAVDQSRSEDVEVIVTADEVLFVQIAGQFEPSS